MEEYTPMPLAAPQEDKEVRGLGQLCDPFKTTGNNDPLHPGLPQPRQLGVPQAGGARHLELRDRPPPLSLLSLGPVGGFRLPAQSEIEQRSFL